MGALTRAEDARSTAQLGGVTCFGAMGALRETIRIVREVADQRGGDAIGKILVFRILRLILKRENRE